jgi:Holliday junction DNA helicase RuvA
MISQINGCITTINPPQVVIETHGVGYEIDLPLSDCALLPTIGSQIAVHTHMVVREDAHSLYGFLAIETRNCFRQLIKVSGIGPRIALALLSTLSLAELQSALENSDIITLCRTPGIGKKMAERMLLELKDKLIVVKPFNILNKTNDDMATTTNTNNGRNDIINALLSLGYNEKEATNVVKQLSEEGLTNLSIGIKEALRLLNKS